MEYADSDGIRVAYERDGPALIATIIGETGTLAGPFYGTLFDENLVEVFDRDIKPFLGDLLASLVAVDDALSAAALPHVLFLANLKTQEDRGATGR